MVFSKYGGVEEGKGKQNIRMTSDDMTALMMRNLVH